MVREETRISFKDILRASNMENPSDTTVEHKEERRRQWRQLYDRNRRQDPEAQRKFAEYMRQWRERNRELVNERARVHERQVAEFRNAPNICECGGRFTTKHRTCHFKSQRHQDWLAQQQPSA